MTVYTKEKKYKKEKGEVVELLQYSLYTFYRIKITTSHLDELDVMLVRE